MRLPGGEDSPSLFYDVAVVAAGVCPLLFFVDLRVGSAVGKLRIAAGMPTSNGVASDQNRRENLVAST